MATPPPPPIPQKLREMLKDYPGHIQTLQNDLNGLVEKPLYGTPIFEQAIWALEDALSAFIDEARAELQVAETSGDAEAVARAKDKLDLMFDAHSSNGGMRLGLMDDLWNYCEMNKRAFK